MQKPKYESFNELYPMPMNSIERFHWFDDDPDFPNLVFCRMRVKGKLDRQTAREAWQITIQRQPIGDVQPKIVDGKWTWVQGPRAEGNENFESWDGTRFEWTEHDQEPELWQFKDHTVRSPTGSYLGVASWPTQSQSSEASEPEFVTEIWFYVHHAIGDGAGSIMCINDWMKVYTNLLNGLPAEKGLHKLDASLMKRRNDLGLTKWTYLKHLWKQPIALFGAAKFVFRKTQLLLPRKQTTQTKKSSNVFPAIIGRWLPEDQVEKIERHSSGFKVMTNTVLLGQLYLALADWRKSESVHEASDWDQDYFANQYS